MLKFDFKTYVSPYVKQEDFDLFMQKKNKVMNQLQESNMTGWRNMPDDETIEDIKNTAHFVKENYDCMVVIGIGGSFLGSYAFHQMFKKYFLDEHFEIIYAGTTLSSKYLEELLHYLDTKNFCIDVISKSGTTMETVVTYQILKDLLKRKYGEDIKKRIYVTTDKEKGKLKEEASCEGYKTFVIPDDIGGRYSFLTPAHLFPLALNYDIDEIIAGYNRGKRLNDEAFEYAVIRNCLLKAGKKVENFCVFEENMSAFTEWLKQLFGETEGKNHTGLFPTATIFTRDLHSLGQFIQEGSPVLFETFFKVLDTKNYIQYEGKELHEVNNIVEDSVMKAHFQGGVPCLEITLQEVTEETVSTLIYFFQLAAAYSAFLMEVNPFDQPGVEVYKKEVKESLYG